MTLTAQDLLLRTPQSTHRDAESFQDVEFTDGTGAVLVQPRVHAHLMKDVSADRKKYHHTHQRRHGKQTMEQKEGSKWLLPE